MSLGYFASALELRIPSLLLRNLSSAERIRQPYYLPYTHMTVSLNPETLNPLNLNSKLRSSNPGFVALGLEGCQRFGFIMIPPERAQSPTD